MAKPAVDLSEVKAFERGNGAGCSVPGQIAKLAPAKRRLFDAALESDLTHAAISSWLKSLGVELSGGTVGRHRKKECRCGR